MYAEQHQEMLQCINRPANLGNVFLHIGGTNTQGRSYCVQRQILYLIPLIIYFMYTYLMYLFV